MIEAGMTVARVNFSHGSQKSNGELINSVRSAANASKKNVGIMADLQGPRIRILNVKQSISIKEREIIFLREGYAEEPEKRNKLSIVMSPCVEACSVLLKKKAKEKIVFMDNLRKKLEFKRKNTA